MNKQILIQFIFSALFALNNVLLTFAEQPRKKPNIIFILTDDLGSGDIGVFFQNQRKVGEPRLSTPSLDRMAAAGAMLTQHYCAAPVCAPSRASILLGKSQGHANIRDNQFDKALENNYTMSNVLKHAGYVTAAIGKWGLQGEGEGPKWHAHPLRRGFGYFYGYIRHRDGHEHYPKEGPHRGPKEMWQNYGEVSKDLDKCYTGDLFTAVAKKYIVDHHSGSDADKPFFIYLAYDTPHAKFQLATQPYPSGGGLHGGIQWIGKPGYMINTASGVIDSYMEPEFSNAMYDDDHDPKTPEIPWPNVFKRYACIIKRVDQQVGDLMQLLDDLGIATNTLVVFTSDNGPTEASYLSIEEYGVFKSNFFDSFSRFDGIKRDLYEGGLRTSTIAWWPNSIPAGTIIDYPSASYDWMPTFLDAAGLPPPRGMDGVSILPVLIGQGSMNENKRLIYSEYFHSSNVPKHKEFIPSRRGKWRGQMQMIRIQDYVGVRYDIKEASDDFEIYDIRNDPQQAYNLATAMPELQQQFKAKVLQARIPDNSAARPYDNALVPPIDSDSQHFHAGLIFTYGNCLTPWISSEIENPIIYQVDDLMIPNPKLLSGENGLLLFKGYLQIPMSGEYFFFPPQGIKCFLKIHQIQVIDNDFTSEITHRSINLAAGLHPIEWYVKAPYEPSEIKSTLEWRIPGEKRQPIPKEAFFTE